MRYMGSLVQWNDERGFGFVQADGGGDLVFVHISAFNPKPAAHRRPNVGQRVEFGITSFDDKQRAQNVRLQLQKPIPTPKPVSAPSAQYLAASRKQRHSPLTRPSPQGGGPYFVLLAFAGLFLIVAWMSGVPQLVAAWYFSVSTLTFFDVLER